MNAVFALLAFIPAIFIVIVIHELGHYTAARLCGVRVLRFSLGMGKILYSRKFRPDGTEWALSLLPLGGYIKLLDARSEDMTQYPPEAMAHEFTSRSVWQRIFIAVAGPASNFLLAVVLLSGLYVYGIQYPVAKLRAVPADSVAYQVGLRGGERITAINNQSVAHWGQVRQLIAGSVMEHQRYINLQWNGKEGQDQQAGVDISHLTGQDLEGDFLKRLGLTVAYQPAVLGELEMDSPAEKAGLRQGDKVLAIDGKEIADSLELVEMIRKSPDRMLRFSLDRNGEKMALPVQSGHWIDGSKGKVGRIGVKIQVSPETMTVRYGILPALKQSVVKTAETACLTVKSIGQILAGAISVKNISGPVAIADYAGKTAKAGGVAYLSFIVFISISIGIMNLLPIPVLDGGLLLYYAVEIIKGSPVSEKASRFWTAIGLGLLGLLMIVAMCNDFGRLFP